MKEKKHENLDIKSFYEEKFLPWQIVQILSLMSKARNYWTFFALKTSKKISVNLGI